MWKGGQPGEKRGVEFRCKAAWNIVHVFKIGSNGVDGRQAVLLENRIVFGVVVEVDGVTAVNADWLAVPFPWKLSLSLRCFACRVFHD